MPQPGDASRETRRGDFIRTQGDGVAQEAFVVRIDPIPLLVFASSALLLAGMSFAIPAEPAGIATLCRSRPADAVTAPVPPFPPRPDTPMHPDASRPA